MAGLRLRANGDRRRATWLAAVLALSLLLPSTGFAAEPEMSAPPPPEVDDEGPSPGLQADSDIPGAIDRYDPEAVTDAYRWDYLWAVDLVPIVRPAPFDWTGSADGCIAEDISAATRQRALAAINFFRAMTGVQPVTFSAEFDAKAQEAALIMHANNALSHFPSPDWTCYSEDGAEGAANSNLSIGQTFLREAIEGYMWDPGAHNIAVGHRRWFLSPGAEVHGFGATSNTTAAWVVHTNWSYDHGPPWMPYPTDGYWPKWLVTTRWSLSHHDSGTDFSNAKVTVTHEGSPLEILVYPPGAGYGYVSTLVWEVTDGSFGSLINADGEVTFDVRVTGIVVDGVIVSHEYTITMFDPLPTVFVDISNSIFGRDITFILWHDVTRGCNPPSNTQYCPNLDVDRGAMAAFIKRALNLPASSEDHFDDDNGSIFEGDINAIAEAGIAKGCNPPENTLYCPGERVTRGAMAAFLRRALNLPASSEDHFDDDNGHLFEGDINAIAEIGVTKGCNPPANTLYCPGEPVSRGAMAAFLARTLVYLGR